jgi:hypothetical protein
MGRYYNQTSTPLALTLTSGATIVAPCKRWVVLAPDDEGSAAVAFHLRKGHLVRGEDAAAIPALLVAPVAVVPAAPSPPQVVAPVVAAPVVPPTRWKTPVARNVAPATPVPPKPVAVPVAVPTEGVVVAPVVPAITESLPADLK